MTKTINLTTCPYCGTGCGVEATQNKDGSFSIKGDESHPSNFGRLCSKGSALADTLDLSDRLLYPQIKGQKTSWDTALTAVSEGLQKIINQYGADAVAFYVSGQLLTEDYYVANKLMKGFIGSANIDTNSRLCMSSAVAGYKRAFGSDSVPCNYEDLEQADLIVIEGSNTAWCHPIIYQRIVKAKEQRPELNIVVIDPRKTATCGIADLHLPLKPGTDATLFNGLLAYIHQQGAIDWDFVNQHTEGFEQALSSANQSAANIFNVAQTCELSEQAVETFFQLFTKTDKTITLYSQGVNQSTSGTDKSNSIINCHLATGRIGRAAMGPFSITGQPNAMGGREVGALSNQLTAHMDLDNPIHHDLVSRFWKTDKLATKAGVKAVEMFEDIANGKIKAIWVIATNPVVTLPNADKVRRAIEDCELVIVSECSLDTGTVARGDILLPALAWGEKCGTVTNSERRISHQRNFLPHPGEAKEDWWILSEVAQRMGFSEGFNYHSSAEVFREYATLSGFENNGSRNFDISGLENITDQAYDDLHPIQWPVNDKNPHGTARLFEDKQFFTASKKAQFIAITPRPPKNPTSSEYPFILNTGRIRDQWHTMSRTAKSSRLNTHISEPIVQIHPDDAASGPLNHGDLARLNSHWGDMLARLVVTDEQRVGSLFVPMHWNDFLASKGRVNALVNPEVDPLSGQPEFKHTPVKLTPYQPAWYGFIFSRKALTPSHSEYWVKIKGEHYIRYEMADEQPIGNFISWSRQQLGEEGEWLDYFDANKRLFRAGKIINDRLEGLIFIAPTYTLPSRTWLGQLFAEQILTHEMRMSLLAGKLGGDQPDVGEIVCACFGVGENTIKDAMTEGSVKTVSDLGRLLKAGTNCGSCLPELKKLCPPV